MSEASPPPVTDIDGKARADTGIGATELIGGLICVVWLLGVLGYVFLVPRDGTAEVDSLRFVITLMAIFLPVAMVIVAVSAARSSRIMRDESRRLQAAIDGMRRTYLEDRSRAVVSPAASTVEAKLDEIARATQKTETALATFHSSRRSDPVPVAETGPAADDQPSLALGTSAEDFAPPLSTADFIRALNFPDTEEDEAGFAALRRALRDRGARQLVQASQDVLTLLSQDGIYMDDLLPDRSRPELWRRFAHGERGRAIAQLGGIRDRSSLALAAGRMREDTIFRDAAHHFLRKFDQMLVAFEPTASDEDLVALSDTRTARAFMLLGRVTGTFD